MLKKADQAIMTCIVRLTCRADNSCSTIARLRSSSLIPYRGGGSPGLCFIPPVGFDVCIFGEWPFTAKYLWAQSALCTASLCRGSAGVWVMFSLARRGRPGRCSCHRAELPCLYSIGLLACCLGECRPKGVAPHCWCNLPQHHTHPPPWWPLVSS